MLEQEVTKMQGARITLENQCLSLESASVNIEVFKTVEQGTKAMKAIRGNIDADRVDDLMDDMAEEKDTADQISNAISRPAQDMFDDVRLRLILLCLPHQCMYICIYVGRVVE